MEKTCPNCRTELEMTRFPEGGVFFKCKSCDGRSVGTELLRRLSTPELIQKVWTTARNGNRKSSKKCPACINKMLVFPAGNETIEVELDVCTTCHLIWFDAEEIAKIPRVPATEVKRRDREDIEKRREKLVDNFPTFQTPNNPYNYGQARTNTSDDVIDLLICIVDFLT